MWTRLEPDLTPFPNSHDLVTRLGARPFVWGRLPVQIQTQRWPCVNILRDIRTHPPTAQKSPENIYSEATKEHFTYKSPTTALSS